MSFHQLQIWKVEQNLGNVSVFSYFFRNMEIHSSHGLGIVWISASHEIFKKFLSLECL